MQPQDVQRAATLLVDARKQRKRLPDLPPELQPANVADAYAVQDAMVKLQGTIGGWKVAPPKAPGADSLCAPILTSNLHASPATIGADQLLVAPEVEVEIAVRFARDLPPRATPYGKEDVAAAIGSIHAALEILASRFENRKAVPQLATVADCQNNGGAVYGPGLAAWRGVEFGKVAMELTFDGKKVGSADGGPTTDEVLDGLTWLANHAAARTGGLKAGQVVITGARIKPVALPGTKTVIVAKAAGVGEVSATVE